MRALGPKRFVMATPGGVLRNSKAVHGHSERAGLTGCKVLLVEDEMLIRVLVADCLADAGFAVIEAETGDQAVLLLANAEHLDLIVTDIQMPGRLDGNGVAAAARAKRPNVPIIYMTGNPGHLCDRLGGGDAVLRKPFAPSEVLATIQRLLPNCI